VHVRNSSWYNSLDKILDFRKYEHRENVAAITYCLGCTHLLFLYIFNSCYQPDNASYPVSVIDILYCFIPRQAAQYFDLQLSSFSLCRWREWLRSVRMSRRRRRSSRKRDSKTRYECSRWWKIELIITFIDVFFPEGASWGSVQT